jgi:hypothetical protein
MTPSTVMWVEMITFPMGTSTVGSGLLDRAKPARRRPLDG